MFDVTAEFVAMYISALLGISVTLGIVKWHRDNRLFICCAFSIALSSFFNIISSFLINNYGITPVWVNYVVTTAYFMLLFTELTMFALYFLNIYEKENTFHMNKFTWAIIIPYFCSEGLTIVNLFTGWIFSFDSSGYVRGPINKVTYAAMIYITLLMVLISVRRGKRITLRTRTVILLFPVLSALVMAIQFTHRKLLLTGTAGLGPLILMMLFLEHDIIDIDGDTGFNRKKSLLDTVDKNIQKGSSFSVVLVSLDNLREISSLYGTHKQRQVIICAAGLIESTLPVRSYFRYAGNRFAFIVKEKDSLNVEKCVDTVFNLFSEKIIVDNLPIMCQISISAVSCPSQAENSEQLSELLEYSSRKAVKSKERIFYCDEDSLNRVRRKRQIAKILKRELEADARDSNFEVYYQPIYDLHDGKFRTAESLVRLNKTEIGPIYPDEFIAIAEEMGMIVRLGEVVLEKVCIYISRLIQENVRFDGISVNFSVHQMMRENIISEVMAIIKKYDIPPEKLRIEITESVIIDNFDHVKTMMETLGSHGIKFYMDDFGTGYSNLSNMMELPFEYLKIDKSLVRSAEKSEKAYSILSFISKAFINQNVKILTEGVETEEQEKLAASIGAEYIQGFRFARPVPGDIAKEYFLGNKNDAVAG